MHADTPVWGILTFWSEVKGECEDGTCHKRKKWKLKNNAHQGNVSRVK